MSVGKSLYQRYYRHFSLPVVYLFHLAPPDVLGVFWLRFITLETEMPYVVCSENYGRQIHFVGQVKFFSVRPGGTCCKCCDLKGCAYDLYRSLGRMTTSLAVPSLAFKIYLTHIQLEFPKIMLAVETGRSTSANTEVRLRKFHSYPPPQPNADTQNLYLLRSISLCQ